MILHISTYTCGLKRIEEREKNDTYLLLTYFTGTLQTEKCYIHTSSGRPISLFPYRPIPIITDISDFHIGRYRCRYRYSNCHIGRYRCRYRYGNATYSKCNKMQFFGKKVIFFSIFLIFLV